MKGWNSSSEHRYIPNPDEEDHKTKIATLTHMLTSLQAKYEQMENYYLNEISKLKDQIISMQKNLDVIIKDTTEKVQKQVMSILEGFWPVPKQLFEQYPMLQEMVSFAEKSQPSSSYAHFCVLIYSINSKIYKILRDFLPVPTTTFLKEITKSFRLQFLENIQNFENIFNVVSLAYNGPMPITLGGDAAAVKATVDKPQNNMYTYMILPIDPKYKTIPAYICPTSAGASNQTIVNNYDAIAQKLEELGFLTQFFATDGDQSFNTKHINWFKNFVHPTLQKEGSFRDKMKSLANQTRIPVNDLMHLLKNGRSHILLHPMCLDRSNFICLNMEEFEKALDLGPVISDKSSIAAMKDSYALQLFSWESFIKLLSKQRFDGAFYIMPFLFMIQSTRSKTLSIDSRLALLECAIKQFYFYLKDVSESTDTDFFTPSFTHTSIGTLFGDAHYIIRLINTCVAHAITMVEYDRYSSARVATYDIECFFGRERIVALFNYAYDNMLNAAAKAVIINEACAQLGYELKISKRDNEGGASIDKEELYEKMIDVNFAFIYDIVFKLFKCVELDIEVIDAFQDTVNGYTNYLFVNTNSLPKVKIQSVFSGTSPHYRYRTNSYIMSLLPLPGNGTYSTPFSFFKKDISCKRRLKRLSTYQWFCKLLCTITNIQYYDMEIEEYSFPKLPEEISGNDIYNIISNWINCIIADKAGEIRNRSIQKINLASQSPDAFMDVQNLLKHHPENQVYEREITLPKRELTPSEFKNIDLLIKEFIQLRSKKIKNYSRDLAMERIKEDLNILSQCILSHDDKFMINSLNNIDLSLCMKCPKLPQSIIDKEGNIEEENKIDSYSYIDN